MISYYFHKIWNLISLKSIYYKMVLSRCESGLIMRRGTFIRNPQYVNIGKNVVIDRYTTLCCNKIGDKQPVLTIGNGVSIGEFSLIGCSNQITIEENVMFAPHVHITDRNHLYEDVTLPINKQAAVSPGPILIRAGSWLGHSVQVMPNVTIGKHCVIAAGAIVTKDIPDYSVAAGIPARVIKKYDIKEKKWIKI